ncbi:HAMP domain-containing protein [Christensenellaceae bacterium OttesenSCG-928-M15]|nr:HAMP domain-containing protein [Christensenellaceae bacterium OttesenSCG-928-M15]
MRKDLFKTLFARMLTTYLAVILLLLLLMGITVSSMFNNQYIGEEEDIMRKEVAKINATLVELYPDPEKRDTVDMRLKTVAQQYDALILWIDSTGSMLTFHDSEESQDKWGVAIEAVKQYLEEEPMLVTLPGLEIYPAEYTVKSTERRFLGSNEKIALTEAGVFFNGLFEEIMDVQTLSFVRALVNNGRVEGTLIMTLDMRAVNASISQVYMDVLLIGLLAVVVAVLAVYYLTTRITKPITDMNATVRKYSKGSFELRLDDEGADEVAQLAKSFNVMAAELATLEKTRRSFVANVSHELRSPLTSISGFLEAIQDGTIPKERQGEYIGLVIAETKRMTNMVNDLLDLARIESGQNPLKLTQFDMNELSRRTVLTFEARINSKQLDVELELMEPHCYVEADQDQMAQVLRNLIDNAIKYSPDKGTLTIRTNLTDRKTVAVSVKDSGQGIPKEDLAHVFKRFYKVEKAHTPTPQSGTGLGLSIVRSIIDRHEQDIYVQSAPGEGTTFTFTVKYIQDIRRRNESKPDQKNRDSGGSIHGI